MKADALHLALLHVQVLVLRRRVRDMPDHRTDALGVRLAAGHALLRLAHLAGRHHFHRLRDLLRAGHAGDLGADFLCACHVLPSGFLPGLGGNELVQRLFEGFAAVSLLKSPVALIVVHQRAVFAAP
jgi:hypothetical protein